MSKQFKMKMSEATAAVLRCVTRGLVPLVKGQPGAGKSDMVRQVAKQLNLKVIDIRLSQAMPEDLQGFPQLDKEKSRAFFAPFDQFPIEGDAIPEGFSGWLIFLDELTSAPKSIQAAAYKLILDRMVGTHNLHESVAIVAAGNRLEDKAVVVAQSTALQSRLIHLEVVVDKVEWIDWAHGAHIDSRITGFIEHRPGHLNNFDPNHSDETFACPRTWSFVNSIIWGQKELTELDLKLVAGAVGDGVAMEFYQFAKLFHEIPKIEEILKDPVGTPVPNQAPNRFAVVSSLMEHVSKENIAPLLTYVTRFSPEFQMTFLVGANRRNPLLASVPEFAKYVPQLYKYIHTGKQVGMAAA